MMKKLLIALVLSVASVTLVAPAAHADTPGCVSRREFRHVHPGMRKLRVHRIFDTSGHLAFPGIVEIRNYRSCARRGAVAVTYRRGRLSGKFRI